MAGEPENDTVSPAASLRACACFNARTAARSITDLYDRTLAPSGLRLSQVAILAAIAQRHGATMQELASDLGLDPSTMTRTMRPLEHELLVRTRPADDRRAKTLELTAAGQEALARSLELWTKAQQTLKEKIGDGVFERLNSDLLTVIQALR